MICGIMAVCVLVVAGMVLYFANHNFSDWIKIDATCHEGGYEYRVCKNCDLVEYRNRVQPTDHTYSEHINDIVYRVNYAVCTKCGYRDESAKYEPPKDFPIVYFNGTTGTSVVSIDFKYQLNDDVVESYGDVNIDPNSDNIFRKKDYDFQLYSDKQHTVPFKFAANDIFGEQSEYVVRAEYLDMTGIRNLAASDLWSQVVSSRKNLNNNLSKLKYFGADFGVPALLYTNGNFKGLHTLNFPNNQLLFGLENNNRHALIYSKNAFGYFDARYESGPETISDLSVIWPDNDLDSKFATDSYQSFSEFVKNSNDRQFRQNLSSYLDVDAAIDYLICVYAFGADSNIIQHCNWVTYNGKKWIPSMYNLTYTFGLTIDGTTISPSETMIPQYTGEGIDAATDAYLWTKLINNFETRIRSRYTELRQGVLSDDNVSSVFNKYYSMIPEEVYEAEIREYPEKNMLNIHQGIEDIISWYSEKASLLDSVLKES